MTKHRIILEFENEETLDAALEYIGDTDAPVMIVGGQVESAGSVFPLWDEFDQARQALVVQVD